MQIPTVDDFLNAPGLILDVRSPSEYAQGHIPGAVSFPLFSDEDRAQVGTCYKQQGREQAVELGFAIAGPKFVTFLQKARALAGSDPLRLHCWRGGMRSEAVAWVLTMGGLRVNTLKGGYKAFRRWVHETCAKPRPIVTLGGMTGTGKTDILQALAHQREQVLDLEALASHRGSSFGALGLPPQPTNEQFSNLVALHCAAFDPQRPVWIEAESRRIGQCRVPDELFQQMMRSPIVQILRSRAERLQLLVDIYGTAPTEELVMATERIRKRLGGQRTQQAIALLQDRQLAPAFDLILDYYDRTYQYDLDRRQVPIHTLDVAGLSPDDAASQAIATRRSMPKFASETT